MMRQWLFPCNIEKYDILGSFLKNGFVDYGTNLNIIEGDEVFIYIGSPYSAIFLKCRVRTVLTYEESIDDEEFNITDREYKKKSKAVRLIPVQNYLNKIDMVNYSKLKEHGIKGCSFQIELPEQLSIYLNTI